MKLPAIRRELLRFAAVSLSFARSLRRSICEANTVDANLSEKHPCSVSAKPQAPTSLPDPNNLRDVLAYWMRLKRVEKGWSQERLAMECDLDRTYVSAVERSRWNVSLSNIERFAQALDAEPWMLLRPPNAGE